MKKKGQIYVLAAVMISIIIYSLSTTVNVVKQESLKGEFTQLAENYNTEASRTLNSLITLDSDPDTVSDGFKNFTALFTAYSKSQNPLFGVIYTLDYGGTVEVGNFLQTPVAIEYYDGATLQTKTINSTGCFSNISAAINFEGISLDASGITLAEVNLSECIASFPSPPATNNLIHLIIEEIGNTVVYTFKAESGISRIMIVGQQNEGTQSRVYVGGEGFEPTPSYCSGFTVAECIEGSRSSVCCVVGTSCQDLGLCACSEINLQPVSVDKQAMCEKHPTCCWDCAGGTCTESCAPQTPCQDYTEQSLCESESSGTCCWEEGSRKCKFLAGCGTGCIPGTAPQLSGIPNIQLNVGATSSGYNLDTYASDDGGVPNLDYEIAEQTNLMVANCGLIGGQNKILRCKAETSIGTSRVKVRAIDTTNFASDYYDTEELPYEEFSVSVSSPNSIISCKKQYQIEECLKSNKPCKNCPGGTEIDCVSGELCGLNKVIKTTICEDEYTTACLANPACNDGYAAISQIACTP